LATLQNYQVDSPALVDLRELRYQWFNHVFKGAAIPPLLKAQVNYEVMAPRVAPRADARSHDQGVAEILTWTQLCQAKATRLTQRRNPKAAFILQTVNLADRKDRLDASTDLIQQEYRNPQRRAVRERAAGEADGVQRLFSGRLDSP